MSEVHVKDQLKIVIVGHVDHGKSTMIGRMLYDTNSLPEGKYESVKRVCDEQGKVFEFAFLLDALQEERSQGITIDVAQVWFNTPEREYIILDAPGHKEFLKNMISGAASAEAALLLIDAKEGVQEQSHRHGYMLSLLGIRQVIVVVNKMDLVDYSQEVFQEIEDKYRAYLENIGISPITFIPISARDGDNIAQHSEAMNWYQSDTIVSSLDRLKKAPQPDEASLRFPLQDVYKFDERRILAGQIASGRLSVGDKLLFSPSNKRGVVKSIEKWSVPKQSISAAAGESIGLTLTEQIFVERGDIGSHIQDPPMLVDKFTASLFWMGEKPMKMGQWYNLKLSTQEIDCQIVRINKMIDVTSLATDVTEHKQIEKNDVAEVVIKTRNPIALDRFESVAVTGRFVVMDDNIVRGGGIITLGDYPDRRSTFTRKIKSANISRHASAITVKEREARNGHQGGVIWLTGLPSSGKSTLAVALEQALFSLGIQTYRLDGDNVRMGLSADLGFLPNDRVENIRRVSEVARLFSRAGVLVVSAFISPYATDRILARQTIGDEKFIEVFLDCPIEVCEERDAAKDGHYQRAREGDIRHFTGVSAPYEKPQKPNIYLKTAEMSIETEVEEILHYLIEHDYIQVEDEEEEG